ncbi:unnamed protein product [Miscanthus lutarioriparius]|uniref:Secretory carrier-associated membrane protein n=1 Tax=Miscanthus lutarioriparius TaxID=422564 RepID=A0A811R6F7_9POAL|nr:unnamed protein product [Miscanthus lutarioriparius]
MARSDAEGLVASVEALKESIRGLHVGVLVNNAGLYYPYARYFHEVDEELMRSLIRVNVEGVTQVTHGVLPGMVERKRGAIVNIGSGAVSVVPSDLLYSVYAATKAIDGGSGTSVPMEENWPPFFPIIDRDIANEIPANVQKLQYLVFCKLAWFYGGVNNQHFRATKYCRNVVDKLVEIIKVLGTPTREEIRCMNRTPSLDFPHIKAHPWRKIEKAAKLTCSKGVVCSRLDESVDEHDSTTKKMCM